MSVARAVVRGRASAPVGTMWRWWVALALSTAAGGLDLTPSRDGARACVRDDGAAGVCVSYRLCRENFTLDVYGTIDDNEIRVGNCAGRYDWCCSEDMQLPYTAPKGCARDGGRVRLTRDGRGCPGALLERGAVLFTASCARAERRPLRVQLGGTDQPLRAIVLHPDYNSGSRAYDLALALLTEPAAEDAPVGCVARGALPGDCATEEAAALTVSEGRCGARGGTAGARCGRGPGACAVRGGAPLVCGGVIAGVARGGGCLAAETDQALFSALDEKALSWLDQLLPDLSKK